MFGVLGYCPANIRLDFDLVGRIRPIPKSSFLATAYAVYQRIRFRHNLHRRRTPLTHLQQFGYYLSRRAGRNPALLKSTARLLKSPSPASAVQDVSFSVRNMRSNVGRSALKSASGATKTT